MSKTDLKRLKNMRDEDIDYSDIPPSSDEELTAMRPLREVFPDLVQPKKSVTLQIDGDVLQWFKQTARSKNGVGYQTLINTALHDYTAAQQKPRAKTQRKPRKVSP